MFHNTIVLSLVALTSFVLVGLMRSLALKFVWLDVANARSLHSGSKPRGGGLAIVIANLVAVTLVAHHHLLVSHLLYPISIGGLLIAAVGLYDDLAPVSVRVRLAIQSVAAWIAVSQLGGITTLTLFTHVILLGAWGKLLAFVGVLWLINLFNFMDGIDGLATSQAIFMLVTAAVALFTIGVHGLVIIYCILAAALSGFLVWNWAPAKIFLGDVGSSFIGYMMACLLLHSVNNQLLPLTFWLTIGGCFFVDATYTLLKRLATGQRVYQAHRLHAYQKVSLLLESHARVVVLIQLINCLWLLPLAFITLQSNRYQFVCMLSAILPLLLVARLLQAGKQV